MSAARGLLPATTDVSLAVFYVLAATGDAALRSTVLQTLRTHPNPETGLSQRTHSKVIELLAEARADGALDGRLIRLRNMNDRTALMIAARANAEVAEMMADDHERLMVTPDVYTALLGNTNATKPAVERARAYMRMQNCLPDELPLPRGAPAPAPVDLEAEIDAALEGRPSPALLERQSMALFDIEIIRGQAGSLSGFSFDFKADDEFSLDLTNEGGGDAPPEVRQSIEKQIAAMSPGKKIKLAYLGNKETRGILIRDRNKQVSLAVVKSGRMTENEALTAAGNRNLGYEVLRELSTIREWMRKYPIKLALVNNPRCPASIAVPLVNQLHQKDLEALGRNRNVSSVVFSLAVKLAKQKAMNKE